MKTPEEKPRNSMMDREETKAAERLPWHKPEIERLHVTLDTRSEIGSTTDFNHTGGLT